MITSLNGNGVAFIYSSLVVKSRVQKISQLRFGLVDDVRRDEALVTFAFKKSNFFHCFSVHLTDDVLYPAHNVRHSSG